VLIGRVARAVGTVLRGGSRLPRLGKYAAGLMSDLPRKNGWTLAEHAGDVTPDRMQRLLNHAVWDHDARFDTASSLSAMAAAAASRSSCLTT
jgi:hypothetical protein